VRLITEVLIPTLLLLIKHLLELVRKGIIVLNLRDTGSFRLLRGSLTLMNVSFDNIL
jgi:hypothetical protein